MGLKLGIDSGGSKTLAVLFDDEYNLLGHGVGGGANAYFESSEAIAIALRQCLGSCLQGFNGAELDTVYITALAEIDVFASIIRESCAIRGFHPLSEGETCLLAGAQRRRGFVALSGTGATLFALDHGLRQNAGGWGSWIGDEGSGYYVGHKGIGAAIRDVEGRGPATAITSLIMDRFGLSKLYDLVDYLSGSPSQRIAIASVSRLVAEAAKAGDAVAERVLQGAGTEMASQMLALMNREKDLRSEPIAVAGSVWKSGRAMFDSFCAGIRQQEPNADIRLPLFEPVMGGVIASALQAQTAGNGGGAAGGCLAADAGAALDGSTLSLIVERFDRFRYRTDWD